MTTAPHPLEGQCEWTASDMADESGRAEIDGALRHAQSVSGDILEIGVEDFPLPTVGTRLAGIERELIDGRGFVPAR